jgi:hypothetical protein
MENKFQIGDDGSIFTIIEDGTIRRIGKIDSQGNVGGKKRSKLWIFLGLLIITTLFLWFELSSVSNDLYKRTEEVINLEDRFENLENRFDLINSTYPFKIEKIELGNVTQDGEIIDDYEDELHSSRMRFLKPKIYYTGFVSKDSINIYRRLIYPNSVRNNSYFSHLTTYTYDEESVTINAGSDNDLTLTGYGHGNHSLHPSGLYRIEIWYNDICLGVKDFTIY